MRGHLHFIGLALTYSNGCLALYSMQPEIVSVYTRILGLKSWRQEVIGQTYRKPQREDYNQGKSYLVRVPSVQARCDCCHSLPSGGSLILER